MFNGSLEWENGVELYVSKIIWKGFYINGHFEWNFNIKLPVQFRNMV